MLLSLYGDAVETCGACTQVSTSMDRLRQPIEKLPMILLMSEGRNLRIDERCLKFLRTYAEKLYYGDFEKN